MKIFTLIVFIASIISNIINGIRHGFDAFDIVVTGLNVIALGLNTAVLIRDRRK